MMMADICKPADEHINNYLRIMDSVTGNSRTTSISAYYSKDLKNLIRRCRAKAGSDRPDAYTLYAVTKEKMEYYRAKAYAAEEESRSKRYPGYLFHEKVLFTKADQELYKENSDFRGHFLEANLGPVWEAEGKFDFSGLVPETNEADTSFETDHVASLYKRRTAPEARVRSEMAGRFITTRCWKMFIRQTFDPAELDRLVAPTSEQ